jgi:hypothetical protein
MGLLDILNGLGGGPGTPSPQSAQRDTGRRGGRQRPQRGGSVGCSAAIVALNFDFMLILPTNAS